MMMMTINVEEPTTIWYLLFALQGNRKYSYRIIRNSGADIIVDNDVAKKRYSRGTLHDETYRCGGFIIDIGLWLFILFIWRRMRITTYIDHD